VTETADITAPVRPNAPEFTVSELSSAVKRALEENFGYVRLRGEVSGFRGPAASGHCYFALKDDKAKIDAVIWRGVFQRLRVRPEEGMEVVAQGRLTSYPGSSKYQIVIETLEPAGLGALMVLLEERKRKFAAEGLFDEARKKARPFLPRVVGIVTSPTGAVIRDMLHGFDERFPTRVIVWPVRVQGEGSAAEIAAAIRGFNALQPGGHLPCPDVLIVARGGGSLEDLWGFNEESVVRAVADSRIPLISAVGHETDWTLIDLVADARAPTPTKAAEWAVPKFADLADQIDKLAVRERIAMRRVLEAARTHLKACARGLPRPEDIVALPRQRFDAAEKRLGRALLANTRAHHTGYVRVASRLHPRLLETRISKLSDRLAATARRSINALLRSAGTRRARLERAAGRMHPGAAAHRIARARDNLAALDRRSTQAFCNGIAVRRRALDGCAKLLVSVSHQSVLARGFALVRDDRGRMVRQAAAVQPEARLSVEFIDGQVNVIAVDSDDAAPPPGKSSKSSEKPARRAAKSSVRSSSKKGQGSLF
jgi:exodeoxyribonuclease VII large subunit